MNWKTGSLIVLYATLLAIVSYKLFSGWYTIIPWTLCTLMIGYRSLGKHKAIYRGALFGYILFLLYIIIGYAGQTDQASLLKFGLFAVSFSLVGAFAGIIGSLLGYFLDIQFKKKKGST